MLKIMKVKRIRIKIMTWMMIRKKVALTKAALASTRVILRLI